MRKLLIIATCTLLAANTASADLIHRWSFEGSTDDSVGAANATLNGGATVSGGRLQLSGSNQYATLPIDETLSTLNSTTIEVWATYNALTPWGRIFDFGDGDRTANPNQGYFALTGSPEYSSTISFAQFTITQSTNTNSENLYAGTIPGPGVELHYAVVIDHVAEIGTLYINGVPVLTQTITLTPADVMFNDGTEHNWLGRSRFTQDSYMNGSIEEFRIYDHALSSSEVLASFQNGPNAGTANEPPTANAGMNQSIHASDVVMLDGSASFDDNTAQALLEYDWSFVSTPGTSNATLDDPTLVMPSFVADVTGTYVLQLVVTDEGGLSSEPAFVEISSSNLAPTAVATADVSLTVIGNEVNFDGTDSSDPEMDEITFSWSITAQPAGSSATLTGEDTPTPTLTPDFEGIYEVSLTVSDFLGPGAPTLVIITATTASGFAEDLILQASDRAAALDPGQVTTKGNQNAFGNFLAQAISKTQDGDIAGAIDKLNKAIARTDGCVLNGSPDGNGPGRDWITDCAEQEAIYDWLTLAVDVLQD